MRSLHAAHTQGFWGTLTDVGGRHKLVDVQVEDPGGHGVHLDEGDAAVAPLRIWLVDREEGLREQVGDALGDALGVDGHAGQQMLNGTHVPKLAEKEHII